MSIHARRPFGVSLIELMVALAIAALLSLGLLQIFAASSDSARMQEGLSRVQENGRFAMQYLQRNLNMVGFEGCGSDVGRMQQASFVNHLATYDAVVPGGNAVDSEYRFQRPLEAFRAGSGTVPPELSSVEDELVTGSDVLILRVPSEESVPVISITRDAMILRVELDSATPDFLPDDGVSALFYMQNCRSADVFSGALAGPQLVVNGSASPNVYMDPSVSSCGASACPWDFRISNATLNARPLSGGAPRLNAEIHRAEYMALYVLEGSDVPGLYLSRFGRNSMTLEDPVELVQGVENMQLRFGYDTSTPVDGMVDEYRTAEQVTAGLADAAALDEAWRRVLSVRVALLIRSADRAAVSADTRTYDLLGEEITPDVDGRMRQVYETTVALRNRLFNS